MLEPIPSTVSQSAAPLKRVSAAVSAVAGTRTREGKRIWEGLGLALTVAVESEARHYGGSWTPGRHGP
ncbi:hypothetical protein FQA47_000181 [Oryzias melastigma]|uniref:Uncharacterized protein n=1 Tax=Oryzias melastigma TaxID=30732 RepID=A0A834C4R5_ORYME|nr:hypothetical protein FQA47_000181 [Oryzias melastigma]